MAIDLKLIDQLLAGYKNPEDIIGENGLLKQLTKAVLERALSREQQRELEKRNEPKEFEGGFRRDRAGNAAGP
jgi:hypothetical protein